MVIYGPINLFNLTLSIHFAILVLSLQEVNHRTDILEVAPDIVMP